MAGGWVSAGETVLIDSEEPPSRRSKSGGPAPGPLFSSLCPFSALSLTVSRSFLSFSLSFSPREQTWLLRTSASPLATLDSYPLYPSFLSFPRSFRDDFEIRGLIRSSRDWSRSIISLFTMILNVTNYA